MRIRNMKGNKMIELYTRKEECCGCSACANVCHKHAIHMEQDEKDIYIRLLKKNCVWNVDYVKKYAH